MRVERASNNPLKDQERARLVAPYVEAWRNLPAPAKLSEAARAAQWEYRWMVEEYKVSVFAQELGTAHIERIAAKALWAGAAASREGPSRYRPSG